MDDTYILEKIVSLAHPSQLYSLSLVSKRWHMLCKPRIKGLLNTIVPLTATDDVSNWIVEKKLIMNSKQTYRKDCVPIFWDYITSGWNNSDESTIESNMRYHSILCRLYNSTLNQDQLIEVHRYIIEQPSIHGGWLDFLTKFLTKYTSYNRWILCALVATTIPRQALHSNELVIRIYSIVYPSQTPEILKYWVYFTEAFQRFLCRNPGHVLTDCYTSLWREDNEMINSVRQESRTQVSVL